MVDKRGLGGLGVEPKPKSRLPTLSEFFNPFSLPPGETDQGMRGPTLRDVIVPPASTSPVRPPGLLQFLNPFSAPPGQADPVGYRPDQVGPYPRPYANEQLEQNPVYPERLEPTMPPGWQPPLTLRQRIERGLEAQQQRRHPYPSVGHPVLRRKKPKRPKSRESEA